MGGGTDCLGTQSILTEGGDGGLLFGGERDFDCGRSGGGGAGLDGAGKLTTESGDFDFKLTGLKFNGREGLLVRELVAEAEFEDRYDGVPEFELLLPKISASTARNTVCELDPVRRKLLSFSADDPLGEKNSSSSSLSLSLSPPPPPPSVSFIEVPTSPLV